MELYLVVSCIFLFTVQGTQSQSPVIYPSPTVNVMLGDNLIVTCAYNASQTIDILRSLRWETTGNVSEIIYYPGCRSLNAHNTLATCNNSSTNIYTLQIMLTNNLYSHDDTITCEVQFHHPNPPRQSNTVVVITVPVKTANLIQSSGSKVSVIEGLPVELRCTSEGRPRPTINWYKQKDTEPEIPIPGGSNTQTIELGTESVLLLYPNRTDNRYKLYCKAHNVDHHLPTISLHKLLLDVLYKPDGPPAILYRGNNSHYNVIENTEQISTCRITGGNPTATLNWNCFDGTVILSHDDAVTSTISWSARRKTDGRCECLSQHVLKNETVSFNVNVLYPPIYPTITYKTVYGFEETLGEIKIIEGNNATFNCSSDSKPPSLYYWSPAARQGQILFMVDIMKDVKTINCTTTNIMVPTDAAPKNGTNTSSTHIEVLYPPTPPTLTYFAETSHTITTDTLDVISGDTFSIGCYADGNPLPVYRWDTSQQVRSTISIENIKPDRIHMHTCTASNVMDPTYSVSVYSQTTAKVSLNIMHIPSLPKLYYEHGDKWEHLSTSTIRVIEHTPLNVKCDESTSNPPAVTYHFQGNDGKHLIIPDINSNHSREYTCNVTNVMQRTFGDQKIGHNSTTMTVDVLYPPRIQNLENIQTEEGSILNVKCEITKGNPDNTLFSWSVGQTFISSTATLEIVNVTRYQSALYTCLVYNTLHPTFGTVKNGSDIESFYLDVLYKSSIENFYAEKDGNKYSNITINENDAINLYCSVDSNPNSYIDISLDELQVAVTANSKHLNHSIKSATCHDAGIYTCTGYNLHIMDQTKESTDIRLNVLCNPRASKTVNNITAAAQNTTVHFNATFVAYPVPRYEDYIWRKQQADTTWVDLNTTGRLYITATYLQTDLTINNIHRSDYGNYSLTVSNYVGKDYEQIFRLTPHGTPEKPENVQVVMLENSEVLISWIHGFNGGFEQTFVIQLSTNDSNWYNKTFEDERNDSSLQSWTILKDLEFDKTYYIRLFSFNFIGRSDIVTYPELMFVILSDPMEQTTTDIAIGFIVGVVCGVILIVIAVVAVVYAVLYFQRNSKADKDTGLAKKHQTPLMACACCCKPKSSSIPKPNIYVNVAFNDNLDASVSGSLPTETTVTPVGSKKSDTVANSSGGSRLAETTITLAGSLNRGIVSYSSGSRLTKTTVTPVVSEIRRSIANNDGSRLTERPETPKRTEKKETIEIEALEHAYCNVTIYKSVDILDIRALSMSVRQKPKKLEEQFKGFKNGKRFPTKAADKPTNKTKNRYKEIHPYDKNRVVLPVIKRNPDSDYINASLIKGYGKKSRNYIASQAALENTLPDYWRMIWTQNVTQIVMLTNCIENGRLKCYKYWPNDNSKVYGKITVRIVTEDVYSEYTIRVFDVRLEGLNGSKTVTQYHFTAWPDKDVPDTCVSLVQLWKMVKRGTNYPKSPLMVHCSAGVGRTGTFLALDYLYDQGQVEGCVNFYECVVKLREQRMTMVQTVDQYAFLHHAVLEALDPLVEVCRTDAFRALRQRLVKPVIGSVCNQLEIEYRMIEAECHVEIIPTVGDGNKGVATTPKRDEFGDSKLRQNKDKSRYQDILASDLYRPVLEMVVPGCGDYINAVVLSTYRFIDRMIITQVPLSNTIIDFLRMVWDFEVSTVIVMEKDIPQTDMYWSASGKRSFGIFEAEVVMEIVGKSFIKRTVRYTVNGTNGQVEQKDVLVIQFIVWPEDNLPDPKAMTSLIAELERKHVMTNPDAPFVVQCMDGATKSGLFCVLWSVLERMKFEREVAISETVRFLRTRRKEIIRNFDQYKYCYDLVLQYLDEFEDYANVV